MTDPREHNATTQAVPLHRHNAGLEYLRFGLAFSVVIYHYFYYGPITGSMPIVASPESGMVFLRFAVSAFFIISGFVIALSAEGKKWPAFVASRISRLLPAIFVCATITLVVSVLVGGTTASLENYMTSASLLPLIWSNDYIDGSYWSISYEMRFYAVVLILVAFSSLKWLPEILTAGGVAIFVAAQMGVGTGLELLLYPHIGFFAIGVLMHRYVLRGPRPADIGLWIVQLFLAARGTHVSFQRVDMFDGVRSGPITSLMVVGACIALVILSILVGDFLANRQFPTTMSAVLGGVSYPLYLIHQQFGYDLVGALTPAMPALAAMVIAAIASVVVAFAVHLGVERPVAKPMRRRIQSALSFGATEIKKHEQPTSGGRQ